MIELYFFSNSILIGILILTIILVALQTIHVGFIAWSDIKTKCWQVLSELLLLVFVSVSATLCASVYVNRKSSTIDISNYIPAFYILGIALIVLFFILSIRVEKKYSIISVSMIGFLPIISNIGYGAYTIFYTVSSLALLLRILFEVKSKILVPRSEPNALSIREGLDNLSAGIMFYDIDGYIYLANKNIQKIMIRFFNREFKNANIFWKCICEEYVENVDKYSVKDDIIFRTSTDTWRFSKRTFSIKSKKYIELVASDVTEIDKVFLELEMNKQKLVQQEKDIQELSLNMIALHKEQEYARLRTQVHDVMGQSLTAIQRMLQSKVSAPYNTIIPLLQDIVENIKDEYKPSFQQSFSELKAYFERVGIIIEDTGNFPKDKETSYMLLSIIREATTNAARHANATKVCITILYEKDFLKMEITNNGKKPKKAIVEGSGLLGIRNRVENYGGSVSVNSKPVFCITVIIGTKNIR